MKDNMRPLVLTIYLLMITRGSKVVFGIMNGPRNVRMTSYNMDMVLRWDPPVDASDAVVYTAEYSTPVSDYRPGCVNMSALYCDFIEMGTSVSVYGKYAGRVRALLAAESSGWVESKPMTLDINTTIGPPSVSLVSNGVHMEVYIRDPVFKVSQLRQTYTYATYTVTYWKESQADQAGSLKDIQQNPVVLSDLEPWTRYCVKVRIHTKRNLQPSMESNATCESTAHKEKAPWVEAVVTFVVMATVVTMVVVVVVNRKRFSRFLCPKDSLRQHLKKYFIQPPTSSIYTAAVQPSQEETYDQVSIMAEDEGLPLVADGTNCKTQSGTSSEAPEQTSGGRCASVQTAAHDETSEMKYVDVEERLQGGRCD